MINTAFLKLGIRAWLMQILVAGFNFFVLMNLVYEPLWGEVVAHQIGMTTRIIINFVFAFCFYCTPMSTILKIWFWLVFYGWFLL